ncbi:Rossmann-like domain-containing protein [Methanococcus voltae]|uniref:Uncharacterized protein (DUF4213/DUF364 family) n=2 Tax=Methanococcus voltae TaxID=2188 RepID=A0A8J7S548_METVO|nr:DUF364 domain-containing protein [Methanococcus voltae]MBP2172885.1 uncharacterized protein (DUF4213/DUF364 family) [Methanococcus voltae]MBP2201705.1 uncharacterized protein (DUF4213/DUF364 family) [Methanococcus voltae]MCS3922493.1 uncharacterized protein (DUF4213/DUF364 family) [Methanococcus voltae PS]
MIVEQMKEKAINLIKKDIESGNLKEVILKDFALGLPYAYTVLEFVKNDGTSKEVLGAGMTLNEGGSCNKLENKTPDLYDLLEKVTSFSYTDRALGISAINAISQYYIMAQDLKKQDAVEVILNLDGVKNIGFIGNIAPIANELKKKGDYNIYVFDRGGSCCSGGFLMDTFEYRLLPEMDALFITGSTMVNDTIDMVLDRAINSKINVLTGPTAQMHPELLEETKITHMGSIMVNDVENTVMNLKLGSSCGLFQKGTKYTIDVKNYK